ncbi:MAG: superinfection immunity protein [Bacteroidetes bacterium]|nr:superinfection immunity protein [Bacteroidota bacterium]
MLNSTTFLIAMPGGSEWLLILFILLPLYFLPTIIGFNRNKNNAGGIFVLNFFLGWTFLGWLGALIWAFSASNKQPPTIVVNNTNQHQSYNKDKIDQLRQLKQLLDEGVLTTEEFNKQKAALLN